MPARRSVEVNPTFNNHPVDVEVMIADGQRIMFKKVSGYQIDLTKVEVIIWSTPSPVDGKKSRVATFTRSNTIYVRVVRDEDKFLPRKDDNENAS